MPSNIAQDMGWKDESGAVYGKHDGVLYTMRNVYHSRYDTRTHLTILLPRVTEEQREAFVQEMSERRKEWRHNGVTFNGDECDIDTGTIYRKAFSGRPKVDELKAFLSHVSGYIKEQRLSQASACYVCGAEGADAYALRGATIAHIHDACYDRLVSDVSEQKAKYKSASGKGYLGGLLVAILIGLVGAALHTVLYPFLTEYIELGGLSALLIGWGVALGYRAGGGKAGPMTFLVLLLAWAASFVMFAFVFDTVYFLYQEGERISVANIIQVNADWGFENMLPFLLFNALFSVGAMVSGFIWIREKAKGVLPFKVKRIAA